MNKKQIIFSILGGVFFLGVLGLAVWRIGNLQTVFQRPKATGGAGYCVDPNTTFHLICSNNACVRKRGAGSNLDGCVSVGQNCQIAVGQCRPPSQTHFECVNNSCVRKIGAGSNQGGCTTTGASCGGTTCSGSTPDLCGSACTNKQTDVNNCGACGNACTTGQTCTNGACVTPAECTTDANCAADKKCVNNACISVVCPLTSPVCRKNIVSNHACQSENLADNTICIDDSTDSGIISGGVCQANGASISKCKCTTSSTCATGKTCQLYSGKNFGECAIPQVTEVSVCWGNLGAGTNAGRCYDCNGDGVINILDFSCFAKRWREKVE